MTAYVVGFFTNSEDAHAAVRDLLSAGIERDDISVAASRPEQTNAFDEDERHLNEAGQGALVGAESGAVVGGIVGLLATLGTVASGPVGILIAGPMLGLATGAGIGAVGGGLLGSLIGMGISKEEAELYEEGIRSGGTLVSIRLVEEHAERASQILVSHGAVDIEEQRQGETASTSMGRPTPEGPRCVRVYRQGSENPEPIDTSRANLI